jgi:hypothetical protein
LQHGSGSFSLFAGSFSLFAGSFSLFAGSCSVFEGSRRRLDQARPAPGGFLPRADTAAIAVVNGSD